MSMGVVDTALGISGWMTVTELRWLAKQAAAHEVICEVGSFHGRSTKVLATTTKGVVYSIDNLRGEPGNAEGWSLTARDFNRSLADEITSGKVRRIRKSSIKAAAGFPDGFADMVFIDADHVYPAPKDDIEAWRRVLRPGGLLCGHDADMPGVARSLAEALPDHRLAVDSIWYWQ